MRNKTFAFDNDNVNELELKNKELAYKAALEGIVLLKNDNSILPLQTKRIALFGAGAKHTIKGGTGSGEVNERHTVSIYEALKKEGYEITTKKWIHDYDDEFNKAIKLAKINLIKTISTLGTVSYPYGREINDEDIKNSNTDTAIYVVARQAGEAADKKLDNGDFDLVEVEKNNLRKLVKNYKNVILVINSGASMALSILDEINIPCVMFYCQQGMEGGRAFVDIISGKVSPSGKLTSTWVKSYKDIPNGENFSYLSGDTTNEFYNEGIYVGYRYFDTFEVEPRFHFGHGLSYTNFDIKFISCELNNDQVEVKVSVKNEGNYSGKEVVQVYVSCPSKGLKKEYQRLVGFVKTPELKVGEICEQTVVFSISSLTSFDSNRHAEILDKGDYIIRVGNASNKTKSYAYIHLDESFVVNEFDEICPLDVQLNEIKPVVRESKTKLENLKKIVLSKNNISQHKFIYKEPEIYHDEKVDSILNSLTIKEMVEVICGEGVGSMISNKKFFIPGAVGRSTSKLYDKGLINVNFVDGPAGLRLLRVSGINEKGKLKLVPGNVIISFMKYLPKFILAPLTATKSYKKVYQNCTCIPVGTSLAQTWNVNLVEELGKAVSEEMTQFGVTYWLAPALNIHRNPLCGRNFEYYSEDPFISGVMAAAISRGVQSIEGNYVAAKHYACNNVEDNRMHSNSHVSERALREIYLKAFEYACKLGKPKSVMTSYNLINGVYAPNNYDIIQKVLRNEWGFDGVVMTDWTSTKAGCGSNVLAIKCGNDMIMPGGNYYKNKIINGFKKGELSLEEIKRAAANIIRQIIYSKVAEKIKPEDFKD